MQIMEYVIKWTHYTIINILMVTKVMWRDEWGDGGCALRVSYKTLHYIQEKISVGDESNCCLYLFVVHESPNGAMTRTALGGIMLSGCLVAEEEVSGHCWS